jgi:hypothetical protein
MTPPPDDDDTLGTFAIRGGVIILPVHVVVDIVPIDVVAIARVVERRRSAARRAIDRDGPMDGGGGGDGRGRFRDPALSTNNTNGGGGSTRG